MPTGTSRPRPASSITGTTSRQTAGTVHWAIRAMGRAMFRRLGSFSSATCTTPLITASSSGMPNPANALDE